MIIYLHGFRSAPASIKARALQQHMAARGLAGEFWCEQLPPEPDAARSLIEQQIAHCRHTRPDRPPTLVGSSLGGYYATHLAEKHDLRAVLVNPAVIAPLALEAYIGEQTNLYTGEVFQFTPAYIIQLRAMDVPTIQRPANFWLLAETGDEVLDYRDAVTKYAESRQTVLEGGDHGFSRWNDYLDEILAFADIAT